MEVGTKQKTVSHTTTSKSTQNWIGKVHLIFFFCTEGPYWYGLHIIINHVQQNRSKMQTVKIIQIRWNSNHPVTTLITLSLGHIQHTSAAPRGSQQSLPSSSSKMAIPRFQFVNTPALRPVSVVVRPIPYVCMYISAWCTIIDASVGRPGWPRADEKSP